MGPLLNRTVVGLLVLLVMQLELAASSGPKVELRPLKKATVLAMGQCEVEVVFRLRVSDRDVDDYYCPRVVWEWEDGTLSIEQADCPPIEEALPSDHQRSWTRERAYQKAGRYLVRAHLCRDRRRVATVETIALVTGWEGYPDKRRQEAGCSPANRLPSPPPATPRAPGTTEAVDEGMLLGEPNTDPMQRTTRPTHPRDPCNPVGPVTY